jgi:hypothetical protein
MKSKKEDEEDVSINSERMGSEDKVFTDKVRIHSDININCIVNATFSRRGTDKTRFHENKSELNDNKSVNALSGNFYPIYFVFLF